MSKNEACIEHINKLIKEGKIILHPKKDEFIKYYNDIKAMIFKRKLSSRNDSYEL